MAEEWEPWVHCMDGLPDQGDFIRLKCPCSGAYHEAIFLGYGGDGYLRLVPKYGRAMIWCYWSRRKSGIEERQIEERERELEDA